LHREKGDDGSDDSREVDVNIFAIGVGDGRLAGGDVMPQEDDGEESAR